MNQGLAGKIERDATPAVVLFGVGRARMPDKVRTLAQQYGTVWKRGKSTEGNAAPFFNYVVTMGCVDEGLLWMARGKGE